ncbi:unnamed protein product [Tilletia laevis]|uniref:Histone deacetylase interacting domain-containing protein n=2 Tax=Tilletia TaxID=13289 RepID=A0A177VGG4_9BASI|nr:hypothetical protein CF336_g1477 [Tilletia laevis]KAE8262144.1 hypothetical protein A4X03_0g2684 [Tilletia caries]KAE8207652.1 hypothetical protein CF335_g985 [Tilletia laevis]CAD6885821.1 unnamed protein product [Tilletia caries]CAD6900051.1 unnamed protein product [Tilletia laevis]
MATLNVKDALSYLDQVKVQFQSSPDVYNRFLDIMKDFKSQAIDTPGVIERVSTLFRGHPALIQGFNTFLPPGYRIECITTEDDGDGTTGVITVTTPTGTTTTTQTAGIASILQKSANAAEAANKASSRASASESRHDQARGSSSSAKNAAAVAAVAASVAALKDGAEPGPEARSSSRSAATAAPKSPSLINAAPVPSSTPTHNLPHGAGSQGDGPSSTSPTAIGILSGAPASVIGASGSALPATPGAAAGAGVLSHSVVAGVANPFTTPTAAGIGSAAMVQTPSAGSDVGTPGGGKRPPIEFNHAINYVNKIKMRFAGDPDTYKTFLEILQTYQKEQRPIHDVYAQVTQLFSHATDLLEEFKQFLPDTSGNAHQPPSEAADGHGAGSSASAAGLSHTHDAASLVSAGAAASHRNSTDEAMMGHGSTKKSGSGSTSRGKKRSAADAAVASSSSSRSLAAAAATAPAPSSSTPSGSKSKKSKHSHKSSSVAAVSSSNVKTPSQSAAQQQQSAVLAQQQQQAQQQLPAPYTAAQTQAVQAQAVQAHFLAQSGAAATLDPQQLAQVHQLHAAGLQAFAADGTLITPEMANAAATAHAHGNLGGYALQVANASSSVLATTDEVHFFDRVKKYIDDRPTYTEFLKLLNLFTQDLIDVRTLVDRAHVFFGRNTELFSTFKRLAGYDIGRHGWLESEEPVVENVPAISRDKVDLSTCKTYGASYRKLPESEVSLACSGRDAMCWEVLNDTWVCHPTWASEGESFNPHKKNQYEDALYRSEEERHEYDYHIEANLRTIALLEPIAARIQSMPTEERAIFRLRPGLGGQSRSIYQRVIKKVYGREHGLEVIAALHDNPTVAVPVVLARLKQKDEEWKRAQREWNKVWREVDSRNFYKSLDHQGITFKAADKKNITHKAFIAEIEARRTSQQQRRFNLDPDLPRARTQHQLAYVMDDKNVIFDVLKLSFIYLDRTPYSKPDSDRIEAFLRTFIPKFMCLEPAEFEEALKVHADGAFIGGEDNDGDSDSADELEEEASRFGGAEDENDANKNNGTARDDVDMADASVRDNGDKADEGAEAVAPQTEANWIQTDLNTAFDSTQGIKNGTKLEPSEKKKINFFCNSAYYVFLRLFQVLYSRLKKLKSISEALAAQSDISRRLNPIALELGLQDGTTYPSAAISSTKSASVIINPTVGITAETAGLFLPPSRYYETLLDLTEKLLENDIDQGVFEESVRFMYGIDGYISFTLDKVVGALVKSVQTITTDLKSQELMHILDRDRERSAEDNTSFRRQIASRMAAEAVVGKEENLYRIEWQADDGDMLMQLLSKDDLTLDDAKTNQEQWLYYISSYCLWTDTEGLNGKAQAPFLSRSLPPKRENAVDAPGTTYTIKNGLEIKVCIRTYRLFFVDETEDVFVRHAVLSEPSKYEERVHKLKTRRTDRMNSWLERRRQEIDHPESLEQDGNAEEPTDKQEQVQQPEPPSQQVEKGDGAMAMQTDAGPEEPDSTLSAVAAPRTEPESKPAEEAASKPVDEASNTKKKTDVTNGGQASTSGTVSAAPGTAQKTDAIATDAHGPANKDAVETPIAGAVAGDAAV